MCESGQYTFAEMGIRLGRTACSAVGQARRQGICNRYVRPPKYTYDRSFFSRITLETSYWAAILTTDGCITRRNSNPTIVWSAAGKDKGHMELFQTAIRSTHPLNLAMARCQLSTRDTQKRHINYRLTLEGAREWTADLERNFGVTHNKTLRCPPPNLPTLLHKLAYIRGYIDGDGHITCNQSDGVMSIGVCGVNREMIAWVRQVIEDMDLPKAKKARTAHIFQASGENCYYYSVRGFRAAVLFELLRRVPVPNLSRKWDNPTILAIVDKWKARTDLWPSPLFFDNLLSVNGLQDTPEVAPIIHLSAGV